MQTKPEEVEVPNRGCAMDLTPWTKGPAYNGATGYITLRDSAGNVMLTGKYDEILEGVLIAVNAQQGLLEAVHGAARSLRNGDARGAEKRLDDAIKRFNFVAHTARS
jgi:hypothetical protein